MAANQLLKSTSMFDAARRLVHHPVFGLRPPRAQPHRVPAAAPSAHPWGRLPCVCVCVCVCAPPAGTASVYGSLSVDIPPHAAAATSPVRGINGTADASGFPSMADVAAMLNISGTRVARVLLVYPGGDGVGLSWEGVLLLGPWCCCERGPAGVAAGMGVTMLPSVRLRASHLPRPLLRRRLCSANHPAPRQPAQHHQRHRRQQRQL